MKSILAIGITTAFLTLGTASCAAKSDGQHAEVQNNADKQSSPPAERTTLVATVNETTPPPPAGKTEVATFGSGCFWCTEAIFQRVDGVSKIVSGYEGGTVKNPTYKAVCEGTTGHAECTQITFDPAKVSYDELLKIFWKTHDPTTLNRQGNDVGTQYRSVIFYHNEQQKALAEKYKKELGASGAWDKPLVTEISATSTFYPAEAYHQNYFNDNPGQGYCAFVIRPKVEKFEAVFKDKLKKN